MQAEANHEPERGLPSVVPPSGRHIIQLFVVPGIIVAVALLLLLGVDWLVGGTHTPQEFLAKLQSPNPDVRWRAANDLAQVLKRDQQLAQDPNFALQLAERYQQALADFERAERELRAQQAQRPAQEAQPAAEKRREQEELRARRNYAIYLGSCLGNTMVPVGAPLLAEVARGGPSTDKETRALFRRQAVWALANLGNNLKRYPQLPPDQQDAMREELTRQAEASSGDRPRWARLASNYLQYQQPLGVIDGLAACARDDDIFLRGLVALALNFWQETPEKNRLADKTLVLLSEDLGQGEWIYVDVSDLPALPSAR